MYNYQHVSTLFRNEHQEASSSCTGRFATAANLTTKWWFSAKVRLTCKKCHFVSEEKNLYREIYDGNRGRRCWSWSDTELWSPHQLRTIKEQAKNGIGDSLSWHAEREVRQQPDIWWANRRSRRPLVKPFLQWSNVMRENMNFALFFLQWHVWKTLRFSVKWDY